MATQRKRPPVFDRVPPQSIEAERAVLGAMLLNPDAVSVAVEILRDHPEEVFYQEAHQHIYQAILWLFRHNIAVDGVTLMEQLLRDGHLEAAGGASYISELIGAVPTSANIEYYAKIVVDSAVLRKLIATCTLLASEAYEAPSDVDALLDRAEAGIFTIAEARQLYPIYRVSDLLEDAVSRVETLIKTRTGITGLPTGFPDLDQSLQGFQPSDMIVLAARPAVGKTALALNIAANASIQEGKSVLVFSLEMSKEQLTQRLLCLSGKIDSSKLRAGYMAGAEFPKLVAAADTLGRANLFIDDTPNITVLDLRSKARRHKSRHDLDLVIIDYLQLMTTPGRADNRQQEIAEISRSLKGLARELRIPVLALSQLSREAERDETGMPKLFHLRESGAIEQDADVVLMLSKPKGKDIPESENILRVHIAKQRNGPTGHFDLLFDRAYQQFKPLTKDKPHPRGPKQPPSRHYHPAPDEEEFPPEEDVEPDPPF